MPTGLCIKMICSDAALSISSAEGIWKVAAPVSQLQSQSDTSNVEDVPLNVSIGFNNSLK